MADKKPTDKDRAIARVFLALQDALPQLATVVRHDVIADIALGCQDYHIALSSRRDRKRAKR